MRYVGAEGFLPFFSQERGESFAAGDSCFGAGSEGSCSAESHSSKAGQMGNPKAVFQWETDACPLRFQSKNAQYRPIAF